MCVSHIVGVSQKFGKFHLNFVANENILIQLHGLYEICNLGWFSEKTVKKSHQRKVAVCKVTMNHERRQDHENFFWRLIIRRRKMIFGQKYGNMNNNFFSLKTGLMIISYKNGNL